MRMQHLKALSILAAALVSACGGGSDSPIPRLRQTLPSRPTQAPPPSVPPTQTPPPSVQQLDAAVLRLYESTAVHASLAASPLHYAVEKDGSLWTGSCVYGGGSIQASLDGGPSLPHGTVLPTGTHTLVMTFADCLIDGLVGTGLEGTATAAYTTTDFNHLVAQVSANSMRGTLANLRSDLFDVTADGSGTWTRVWTDPEYGITYTPAIGSRLINNSTTNVATFEGGSYSSFAEYTTPPAGFWASGREEFDSLAITIDGISYILHGSIQVDYAFNAGEHVYRGEVRITRSGCLMARIYGDANGALRTEVLSPLTSL